MVAWATPKKRLSVAISWSTPEVLSIFEGAEETLALKVIAKSLLEAARWFAILTLGVLSDDAFIRRYVSRRPSAIRSRKGAPARAPSSILLLER